ncbi:Hypothetical protein SMAX5B_002918 [Scophthalmus maximus]|uniref:Uncharacterized protein n=1 Tax=Scophthalmus maximus TaxID=52904 RepID=A0A2U9BDJ8_SCOMX|nr:Hypothetical protein SMAX5B_002918 [Scophthalmus maximus]
MKSQTTPLRQSWRLKDLNPALHQSLSRHVPAPQPLSSKPGPVCRFPFNLTQNQAEI